MNWAEKRTGAAAVGILTAVFIFAGSAVLAARAQHKTK